MSGRKGWAAVRMERHHGRGWAVRLTWLELANHLLLMDRVERKLVVAGRLAAAESEELRLARNRIANAADRLRAAKRLLGIGDNAEAENEVRRALNCLQNRGAHDLD